MKFSRSTILNFMFLIAYLKVYFNDYAALKFKRQNGCGKFSFLGTNTFRKMTYCCAAIKEECNHFIVKPSELNSGKGMKRFCTE